MNNRKSSKIMQNEFPKLFIIIVTFNRSQCYSLFMQKFRKFRNLIKNLKVALKYNLQNILKIHFEDSFFFGESILHSSCCLSVTK